MLKWILHTGREPDEAIKLENIGLTVKHYNRVVGFDEKRLPPFVKVRYLYAPGEYEGGNIGVVQPIGFVV